MWSMKGVAVSYFTETLRSKFVVAPALKLKFSVEVSATHAF